MKTITEHRQREKAKVMLVDLKQILMVINLAKDALRGYEKYVPADSILHVLSDNATLVKLYIHKCNKILSESEDAD